MPEDAYFVLSPRRASQFFASSSEHTNIGCPKLPPPPPVVSAMKIVLLEGGAYASLREFVHGAEDAARVEMAKAEKGRRAPPSSSNFVYFSQMVQVQRRDGDAAVQWVLRGSGK